MYCTDNDRYGGSKYKDLIERSKGENLEWMQLRQEHKEKVEAQLKKVMLTKDLPESVAASIREINLHYDKFLEVMDLDMAMG